VATLRTAEVDRDVRCRVVAGVPGRALIRAAKAANAQLVVLAFRADATMSRMLGAVSQFLLRDAPCPALVVPARSQIL
jgi:nucleotide-binding universal stress UspA family protein